MVLADVSKSSDLLVEGTAATDSDVLRDGDLDVVDVMPVPQWFEYRVGESKDEQVLDGFLAEVVIDAEDLLLREPLR